MKEAACLGRFINEMVIIQRSSCSLKVSISQTTIHVAIYECLFKTNVLESEQSTCDPVQCNYEQYGNMVRTPDNVTTLLNIHMQVRSLVINHFDQA